MPNTPSANMGLPIPSVATQPGPQYATDINQCLSAIDQHTHGPGSGVPVGAQGINIQDDLSFNVQNGINFRTTRFVPTTATSGTDIGCLYVKGYDLFFNDIAGNNVRITANGGLASTATSIGAISTTAIISAAGPTPASSGFVRMNNNTDFVSWRNAGNNADDRIYFDNTDNLQVIGTGPVAGVDGSGVVAWNVKLRDVGNNGKVITVTAPTATSSYTASLPPRPTSAVAPLFLNPSGLITTTQQLTRAQLPTIVATSSTGSGQFSSTSAAFALVIPNCSVNFTATGFRPVYVTLASVAATTASAAHGINCQTTNGNGTLDLRRDGLIISRNGMTMGTATNTTPPGAFNTTDFPTAGTYTYSATLDTIGIAGGTVTATQVKLVVYEL